MRPVLSKKFVGYLTLFLIILFLSSCQPIASNNATKIVGDPTQSPHELSPTLIAQTPTESQLSEIDGILQQMSSLPINQFFEESFFQLSLRYPESLAELGIEDTVGITEPLLNDVSQDYMQKTMQLESGILSILQSYDRSRLSPEDQVSYDIYEWYLEDLVASQEFANFQYIASFFILNSIPNQTFSFFTQNHPLHNLEQCEDYVSRLWQIEQKYDQVIEGLRIREQMGMIQPKFSLQWSIHELNGHIHNSAQLSSYYARLAEAMNTLEVTDQQKTIILTEAEKAINQSVIPAYKELIMELNHHEDLAPTAVGLWQYDEGLEYYDYLLRHYTTTNLSADQIHQIGLEELERIQTQMQQLFDTLDYPQDDNLQVLFDRVAKEGGTIPSSQAVVFYENLIEQAYQDLDEAFDIIPQAKVSVVGGPTGGYYIPGSLDGTRPGIFYAAIQGRGQPYYQMPSLTYHEAIPGHHFQIALAQEMPLPTFRKHITFTAYVEGWALYAERLAYDLGWYNDDPYADLGRLQFEALRAARLVVDTGIHAKQWNFQQAVDFMIENVGWSRQQCEDQIARYSVLPGQATAYMIGMLTIIELREEARQTLGDDYQLSEFHNQILSGGSMPLSLLEDYLQGHFLTQ